MMTSTLCTCTWLLLPCCVLVTLSTGELDFYRDNDRETSNGIVLKQLIKYLEGQRTHFSSLLDTQKKRDFLEVLANKENLETILRKGKPKGWNYREMQYNEPINELPQQREHYFPFDDLNPFESPLEYPKIKLPYFPSDTNDEDLNYRDDGFEYDREPPAKHLTYGERNFDKGMKEEPLLEYQGLYRGVISGENAEKNDRKVQKPYDNTPEFTFKFDDSNLKERHPFARKPNDLRYYEGVPFSSDEKAKSDIEEAEKNDTKWEQEESKVEKMHKAREDRPRNIESKFKDTSAMVVPELERRMEYNPLFVPVNQDLNNDIYFIAIVAGCSAAAMFALVLIALTWCRLKLAAKAAADIEYPAYGVTGPNKEISPSGDQRLAQSAQMYHFQHQKQQIIAMEKDPGSVSEAESEEENEEGDYTVYECPGLASTAELEVKNPLFHDDPTPATPAQTNKKEDHI